MNKMRELLLPSVKTKASKYGLDVKMVDAIIQIESGYDFYALRYEPNATYKVSPEKFAKINVITTETETVTQQMSWGLMQIMGFKAREQGFQGPMPNLCDVDTNLELGCKILQNFSKKYGDEEDVIASYNAGSPRKTLGKYVNQEYVNKVLKKMESQEWNSKS